jgi:carnitine 3-dehydrogenase
MSDFLYGHVFGEAMDAIYRGVGVDESYRKKGRMFYTVESHVRHLGEAKVSESLYVTTQVLALDDKRFHVFNRLYRGRDDALIATGEQLHLHVDTAAAKAVPMDKALQAKLDALRQAHAKLPVPQEAGKPVGSRAKP